MYNKIYLVSKIEGCSNYTTHNESWRNIGNYDGYQPSSSVSCDYLFLRDGWHRFTGPAGTRIYTGCPNSRHKCGKQYPGGVQSGSYPHLPGHFSTLKLGFRSYHGCYQGYTTGSVVVKNCGDFFIHKFNRIPNQCWFGVCTH